MERVFTGAAYRPVLRRSLWTRVIGWLLNMDAAYRQRTALRALPRAMRRDIGLTDAMIACEVGHKRWNAPIQMRSH